MVKVESRPMIDEHQSFMPEQHVGIARSAINIRHISVKPDDRRCQQWIQFMRIKRIKSNSAGQVIEAQIKTSATFQESLNLKIGLGTAHYRVQFDEGYLRYR